MKKLLFILLPLVILMINSCDPPVTFSEPQPEKVNNLQSFPKKYLGEYVSNTDNSILTISHQEIIRQMKEEATLSVADLDTTVQLMDNKILDKVTGEEYPVDRKGDSITYRIEYTDTLFLIADGNVLRRFKGYLFLNVEGKQGWEVKRLHVEKGTLVMGSVTRKEDIATLKSISESKLDTMPYQFSPSKRQFREFIRKRGFSDEEVFVRKKK